MQNRTAKMDRHSIRDCEGSVLQITVVVLLIVFAASTARAQQVFCSGDWGLPRQLVAASRFGQMEISARLAADAVDLFEQENRGIYPSVSGAFPEYLPEQQLLAHVLNGSQTQPASGYPASPGNIGYREWVVLGNNIGGWVSQAAAPFSTKQYEFRIVKRSAAFGPDGEWLTERGPRR
jgi:hypothetical protein